MSYVPLDADDLAVGEPVLSSTALQIKNNLDNHEERLGAVETGGATTYPPIIMRVGGPIQWVPLGVTTLFTTMNFNLSVTGVFLIVEKAGSGVTTVDIQSKRGAGAWQSLLTTKPSVNSVAGDFAISSNAVLDLTKVNLLAGDLLRLVVNGVQAGGNGFIVRIDYNKAA